MLNSSILDVAIGMAFIYLLLSLIASTIQEALASLLQLRPANLEHGIRSLFSGGTLTDGTTKFIDRLYRHGLIMGLYRDRTDSAGVPVPMTTDQVGKQKKVSLRERLRNWFRVHPSIPIPGVTDPFLLPAYIPARTFSIALLDILKVESQKEAVSIEVYLKNLCAAKTQDKDKNAAPGTGTENAVTQDMTQDVIQDAPKDQAKPAPVSCAAAEAMLSLYRDAFDNDGKTPPLERFRCHIENWYNDSMDRASGWYKKYTQNVLLVVGLIIAVVFNVDSINVGKKLWFDKDARAGLNKAAATFVDTHTRAPATVDRSTRVVANANANAQSDAGQPTVDDASPPPAEVKLSAKELGDQMKTTVQAFDDVSELYLLPVGWHYSRADYLHIVKDGDWRWPHVLSQIAGWLITALALSLGAPFWFDLLNKFMVVRSTVKPSEKSRTEASKDAT